MSSYQAIVIGVGGMGSSALFHLSKRLDRVLGLEQFDIPHSMGSSHGVNRIIRMAYFEDPSYVPLLRRSYELWRELEQEAGERLLVITGGIDASTEGHRVFQGSLKSCRIHDVPHEVLTASQVNERFPGYSLPEGHMAVFQPDGGYVMSERAIVAHVEAAMRSGAEVHARERVLSWEPDGERLRLVTDRGEYSTERLVVTAGAWSMGLIDDLRDLAVPERQVLAWFQPLRLELYRPDRFPIFNLEVEEGHFYGFPVETIPGFKVGLYHHLGEQMAPGDVHEPTIRDEAPLRAFTERYFPGAAGPTMTLKTCLFTNSPDEHFIIDHATGMPQVTYAAGFSGHGFKFSSVIGEILADLAVEGDTRHDISLLRSGRLAGVGERS